MHTFSWRRDGSTLAVSVLMLIPLTAAVSGCTSAPAAPHQPGAVAIVVGDHADAPKPVLDAQAKSLLDNSFMSKDMLYVVGVSGSPAPATSEQLSSNCDSAAACKGALYGFHQALPDLLDKARATAPEDDTLDSILIAAQELDDSKVSGPKQIVVIDSGLQTAGDLTFQAPGALSVSPAAVISQLTSGANKLKPLDGINILWTGLGTTYAPQKSAPYDVTERLQTIWQAILRAGKAAVNFIPASSGVSAPTPGLPPVTPVSFDVPPPPTTGCVKLREDQVGFLPGLATFRDERAARDALSAIAAKLSASQLHATVIGTAALPGDEWQALSQARADAAEAVLESFGLSKDVLTAVGVGVHFNGFVPDTDANGVLIETEAVQNRLVIIQPVGVRCD